MDHTSLCLRIGCCCLLLFVYKQIVGRIDLTFLPALFSLLFLLPCNSSRYHIYIGCIPLLLLLWQSVVPACFSIGVSWLESWECLDIVDLSCLLWLLLLLVRLVFQSQRALALANLLLNCSIRRSRKTSCSNISWKITTLALDAFGHGNYLQCGLHCCTGNTSPSFPYGEFSQHHWYLAPIVAGLVRLDRLVYFVPCFYYLQE